MQEKKNVNENNLGRWTNAEHKIFLKALERYGRDWAQIQKKVKTRSLTQVRSHANKIFKKIPKEDLDAYIGFENSYPEQKQRPLSRKRRNIEK